MPTPAWPVPQLPLRGLSLDGDLRDEREEYTENVPDQCSYGVAYHVRTLVVPTPPFKIFPWASERIVCASTLYAKSPIEWWFIYTDPAEEDEGELDTMLDGNYGAKTLEQNERIHYGDLKDRYRQRRDRTR